MCVLALFVFKCGTIRLTYWFCIRIVVWIKHLLYTKNITYVTPINIVGIILLKTCHVFYIVLFWQCFFLIKYLGVPHHVNYYFCVYFYKSPWTVDHLVRRSMKNAANCASTCELQDTWTLIFRTHIAVLGYYFQTTPDWGSCSIYEQDWLCLLTIDFGVISSWFLSRIVLLNMLQVSLVK